MIPLLSTVILDPATALIFGSAIALFSGKLLVKNPQSELQRLAVLAAVWSAWYGVCVGWFFFMRPDWMFVYLVDTQKVPLVPTFLLFVAVLVVHGVFGALAVGVLMQQKRTGLAVGWALGAVATEGLFLGISADAYAHVGTFAQYLKGEAPLLQSDEAMKLAMNLSGAGAVAAAVAMLFMQLKRRRLA